MTKQGKEVNVKTRQGYRIKTLKKIWKKNKKINDNDKVTGHLDNINVHILISFPRTNPNSFNFLINKVSVMFLSAL